MASDSEIGGGTEGGLGSQMTRGSNAFRGLMTLWSTVSQLPANIKAVSDIGIDFSTMGKKNRFGVSRREVGDFDEEASTLMHMMPKDVDIDLNDTPYFKTRYAEKVRYLNLFATHPEIEFILHTVTDEAIVYDKFSYFCQLEIDGLKLDDEIKKKIMRNFRKIYSLLSFNDGRTAWALYLQWLIEGYVCLEILYDDIENPKRVVGFEEIRADTMIPMMVDETYKNKKGEDTVRKKKVWRQIAQKRDGQQVERTLPDNSVIFISYNNIPGNKGRISYAERLIRSFNLMRTMENTKVAWHIMNSQFRLKMIIPVGSKTTAKAKQALSVVTSRYKEELFIDHTSGEVRVNGQSKINFGKNIVLPQREGKSPEVDGIAYKGPDLTNMEVVKYFERKLWRDSRLPYSRYDRENGGGQNVLFGANGVPHDEISFFKFINRGRREFEQIIKKPLYNQCIMDYPELEIDLEFKSKLGMSYESNSQYEEAKEQEITNRRLANASNLDRLRGVDERSPMLSKKFLYTVKYKIFTDEEWDENIKMKSEEEASLLNKTAGSTVPSVAGAGTDVVV